MPIPTYDLMLRPILELAVAAPVSRRSATEAMAKQFGLSMGEQAVVTPSGGQTYVSNRVGWAMTFLTGGALIERTAPRQYRATAKGEDFLRAHPNVITIRALKALEGWEEAWASGRWKSASVEPVGEGASQTPQKALEGAVSELHADVRSRLMESILNQSPAFFEQVVLDVLVAMGYGGSKAEAAHHLGESGDEGIDGRINQDPLGLDQILVQAKRNAPENVIDRKTIQAFIGSLAGQGVTKGVFITTSSFASSAKEFVQRGSNTKVVLIDGEALLDLMMRHKIGVRVDRAIELLDCDQNYFEDEG
ncbi:MAG: restriction endonuclease [Thermoanaerobaculia bacterium]